MGSVGSSVDNITKLSNRLSELKISDTALRGSWNSDTIQADLKLATDAGYTTVKNNTFDVNVVHNDELRYTGASKAGKRVKELQNEYGKDNVIVLQSTPIHSATVSHRGYYSTKSRASVKILVKKK